MKCRKCGTEFSEGIFCPECGFKNVEEAVAPVVDQEVEAEKQRIAEKERELQEKEKQLKEEQERLAEEQRKKEQERIEREKAIETEKRCQQEKKAAKEREEAEKMKRDNELIDALKNRLMDTKSQEERRKILNDFSGQLNYESSVQRLQNLKEKANQKPTFGNLINWIFGGTIIFSIIMTVILGSSGNADSPFIIVTGLWYGLGIPIWIVWRIVLIIKSKQKSYYLNIKHI